MIRGQGVIDGIFTLNPYNPTINGSLWSILYEFSFYIFLSGLFFFRRSGQVAIVILVLALLLAIRLVWFNEASTFNFILESRLVLEYGPFFTFGSLFALLRIENLKNQKLMLLLFTTVLILLIYLRLFDSAKFFTLQVIVLLTGLGSWPFINRMLNKIGDISYGVYIYAFTVQQTLMHYFNFNAIELMISSVVISLILGYCSWHTIEKHALKLK